jgi:hypothetical protein
MVEKNDNSGRPPLPRPTPLVREEVTRPNNVNKTPETKKYSLKNYNPLQPRPDTQPEPVLKVLTVAPTDTLQLKKLDQTFQHLDDNDDEKSDDELNSDLESLDDKTKRALALVG